MPKRNNVGGRRKGRKTLTQQQGKGLATSIAKIIGPIIAKEAASVGAKLIGKRISKKFKGKGLRLAGQRLPLGARTGKGLHLSGRGPGKKKASAKQLAALAKGRAIRKQNLSS